MEHGTEPSIRPVTEAAILPVQTIGPETLNMTDKENEPSWFQFEGFWNPKKSLMT